MVALWYVTARVLSRMLPHYMLSVIPVAGASLLILTILFKRFIPETALADAVWGTVWPSRRAEAHFNIPFNANGAGNPAGGQVMTRPCIYLVTGNAPASSISRSARRSSCPTPSRSRRSCALWGNQAGSKARTRYDCCAHRCGSKPQLLYRQSRLCRHR